MIVYVLTNAAMPGLIKIGRTTNLKQRMATLDTSGVPLPFQCYYAATVSDSTFVEGRLHTAFGDFRVREKREFFRLDPYRAKAALEIAAISEVTPTGEIVADQDDLESLVKAQARAPAFRFSIVNVPVGSVLHFAKDESITAVVASDRWIEFEGQEVSLSAAAKTILGRQGYNWAAVQGPQHWVYEGETLAERRERLEGNGGATQG